MLDEFGKIIEEKKDALEGFFKERSAGMKRPIYCSVDLRNAHFKLSAVDTNIFPAGFNNLCTTYSDFCRVSFRQHIEKLHGKDVHKILVLSELATRNKYYLENLRSLVAMLELDRFEVRAGLIDPELTRDSVELDTINGKITVYKVNRGSKSVSAGDMTPDLIISNNDFSSGVPEELIDLDIPIDPPSTVGWHKRRKARHFEILTSLIEDFGALVGMDPWLLSPITESMQGVDFVEGTGLDELAVKVDNVIQKTSEKYSKYEITEKPFVFVKCDPGTFGMAVDQVGSGKEILEMSSSARKKMRVSKGGIPVHEVIIQEGVPTKDFHEDCPLETVLYLVGGSPVGGFFRINCERSARENLNTRGMTFGKICFHQIKKRAPQLAQGGSLGDKEMMNIYGTLARLSELAVQVEMSDQD